MQRASPEGEGGLGGWDVTFSWYSYIHLTQALGLYCMMMTKSLPGRLHKSENIVTFVDSRMNLINIIYKV